MQDPNPKHSLNQTPPAMRPSQHRRAQSEVNFRLPEDLDLAFDAPGGSFEEMEDDLFSTYMDMEKLGAGAGSGVGDSAFDNAGEDYKNPR